MSAIFNYINLLSDSGLSVAFLQCLLSKEQSQFSVIKFICYIIFVKTRKAFSA